MSEIELLE